MVLNPKVGKLKSRPSISRELLLSASHGFAPDKSKNRATLVLVNLKHEFNLLNINYPAVLLSGIKKMLSGL